MVSRPEVVVLVSIGCHPVSLRPRRAELDARAVELALTAVGSGRITLLHAGDPGAPALRSYLGMGLPRLVCLDTGPHTDPLPALAAWLEGARPDLVLAGATAEAGEGSGMVPYWLAHRLGLRLTPGIADVTLGALGATLVQAVAGGRRRQIISPLPLLATVAERAPRPRLPTFGRERQGVLATLAAEGEADGRPFWATRPARARAAKALHATAGTAAERLRALRGEVGGAASPQALAGLDPDSAAERILRYLAEEGLIARPMPSKSE